MRPQKKVFCLTKRTGYDIIYVYKFLCERVLFMALIFDSHCHYDDSAFDDDRFALLDEMFDGKVGFLMHASVDEKSALYGIDVSKKFDNYYTSIGFHPENCGDTPDDFIKRLEALLPLSDKIKAVGEIGLDYHYEGYDRQKQIYIFEQQVEFANRHSLPVIVHSRNATEDTMEILNRHRPKGVMHCFSGSAETAKEVISLGMYVGFTGVITFKNSKKAKKACAAAGKDRVLLETDCPYMAPEPYRGQRSDSRMCDKTAAAIGEIFGISPEEAIRLTSENAKRLFNID